MEPGQLVGGMATGQSVNHRDFKTTQIINLDLGTEYMAFQSLYPPYTNISSIVYNAIRIKVCGIFILASEKFMGILEISK